MAFVTVLRRCVGRSGVKISLRICFMQTCSIRVGRGDAILLSPERLGHGEDLDFGVVKLEQEWVPNIVS